MQNTKSPPAPRTPCPASFVRMFKPRFAPLVERGEKLQTVRPTPQRMPKPGDKISLRCWTDKPYRSKQRVLRDAIISSVTRCEIRNDGIMLRDTSGGFLNEDWLGLLDGSADKFAVADGFSSFHEMADWFDLTHGLPFAGVLICWQNDVETKERIGLESDPSIPPYQREIIAWAKRRQRKP